MAGYWHDFYPAAYNDGSQGGDSVLGSTFSCAPKKTLNGDNRVCEKMLVLMAGPLGNLNPDSHHNATIITADFTVTASNGKSATKTGVACKTWTNDGGNSFKKHYWFWSGNNWDPSCGYWTSDNYYQHMLFWIDDTDIANHIYSNARSNKNYTFTITTSNFSVNYLQYMKRTRVWIYFDVPQYPPKPTFPTITKGAIIKKTDMDLLRAYLYNYQKHKGISPKWANEIVQGSKMSSWDSWNTYVEQHNRCTNSLNRPTQGAIATKAYYDSFNLG